VQARLQHRAANAGGNEMYGGYFNNTRTAAFNKGTEKNVLNDGERYEQAGGNIFLEEADALKGQENFETDSSITQYYLIHDLNYFDL
jgi:hypothetical protein